jgi:glycosyltransferase involved in cell wall biosynthesis
VDDGSTDATRDIADRFRDPRVRLIAGSHPSAMVGLILPRGWHDFLERAALKTTRA